MLELNDHTQKGDCLSRLSHIHTFVQVVTTKSFVRAAEELHITTAAVSKQISTLEQELGVQLLFRTTRTVNMTDYGVKYYEHCQQILREVDAMNAAVSYWKEPEGLLRITTSTYFGNTMLLPHMKEFIELYPKIRLDIEFNERIPDLYEENIDVVVGMTVSADENIVQKRIGNTRYALCAAPAYLAKTGTPKSIEDLNKLHFLTHAIRKPDNVITLGKDNSLTIDPIVRFNDSRALLNGLESGLGAAMILEHIVRDAIKAGTLVELFPEQFQSQQPVYIAYRHFRFIPKKIRCFVDFFVQKIEKPSK